MSDAEGIHASIAFYSCLIIANVWMSAGSPGGGAVWLGLALIFKILDFKKLRDAALGAQGESK
jgi:hypothetical protein